MPSEVRPLGVKCNISCHYCYQAPIRSAESRSKEYDLEKIKTAIEQNNQDFILFGGEPLLVPKDDLEELFSFGHKKYGKSSIQTNGVLLDGDHIDLFKKYNVGVGISIDGPEQCNAARWAGSENKTLQATAKTEAAIRALVNAGIIPGIITTIHKGNASESRLPVLIKWLIGLDELGITYARIHVLEVDSEDVQVSLALSPEENVLALITLDELERTRLKGLKFDIFNEIEALLQGNDKQASCVWRACDPLNTQAVKGIEGFGQTSNCGRTNKTGIEYIKANSSSYERVIALYFTPQEYGGCKGCRFFLMCKGQCPGTGLNGDWRNRSSQCEVWFKLFEHIEARLLGEGKTPLSRSPNRGAIESRMVGAWQAGGNPLLQNIVSSTHQSPTV